MEHSKPSLAEQARQQSKAYQDSLYPKAIKTIQENILDRARYGNRDARFYSDFAKLSTANKKQLIALLKAEGFQVRTRASYLHIKW